MSRKKRIACSAKPSRFASLGDRLPRLRFSELQILQEPSRSFFDRGGRRLHPLPSNRWPHCCTQRCGVWYRLAHTYLLANSLPIKIKLFANQVRRRRQRSRRPNVHSTITAELWIVTKYPLRGPFTASEPSECLRPRKPKVPSRGARTTGSLQRPAGDSTGVTGAICSAVGGGSGSGWLTSPRASYGPSRGPRLHAAGALGHPTLPRIRSASPTISRRSGKKKAI